MTHRLACMLVPLLLATQAGSTQAEVFCVETAAELTGALTVAGNNHEHDKIRLRKGVYPMANGVYFDYNASESENFDLELSGGWYQRGSAPCGAHSDDPWETVLDGENEERVLLLDAGSAQQASISVRLLTFMGGFVDHLDHVSGLDVQLWRAVEQPTFGRVSIERNVFLLNEAGSYGGALRVNGGYPRVTNNLFLMNDATTGSAALLATWDVIGVVFTNNTVISNEGVAVGTHGRALVANNNFWNNTEGDLETDPGDELHFYNNNYQSIDAAGDAILENNINVEPEYQAGLFNYTPVRGSPLVDAGREPQGTLWYLTDVDLNDSPRMVGAHVDIGAFENEKIFADGFELPGPFGLAAPRAAE